MDAIFSSYSLLLYYCTKCNSTNTLHIGWFFVGFETCNYFINLYVVLICVLITYYNIHRRGADLPDVKHADKDSLALFKASVRYFQECESLKDCIPGHLCAKTTAKLLEFPK